MTGRAPCPIRNNPSLNDTPGSPALNQQRTGNRRPTRVSVLWLLALSLLVAFMVYMTLSQIKKIAEDNVPTAAEHAQCLAEHDSANPASIEEACRTTPNVIFAARHPIRNTIIVGILLFLLGYGYLLFHFSDRGSNLFGKALPRGPSTRDRVS